MLSMGCLKLTYQNLETPLKVVYKKLCFNENTVQLWLSVDPLASKYPSMSPYMYVRGNPVMLIDKWGLEGEPKHSRFRKFLAKVNPWEISKGNKIYKSQFHIGKFHFGKGNQVLAKREVLAKEKKNYEDVNIVYHSNSNKDIKLDYQYSDRPAKTYNINQTIPNPFSDDYADISTYTVATYDGMTSSRSNWNDSDGQTINFTLTLFIDPKLFEQWASSGGRGPSGVETSFYSVSFNARSKPMSFRVPKGMFGRLKYKDRQKIDDDSSLRTVHKNMR